jgi:trans-aconitate methyltransferase
MPANVEVRKLDIREEDVGTERYDLVHCRALLMHLPDPTAVLARMVGALRPGGVLLAEEGDWGVMHFAGHPSASAANEAHERLLDAIQPHSPLQVAVWTSSVRVLIFSVNVWICSVRSVFFWSRSF